MFLFLSNINIIHFQFIFYSRIKILLIISIITIMINKYCLNDIKTGTLQGCSSKWWYFLKEAWRNRKRRILFPESVR